MERCVWFVLGCYTDCVPMERCLGGCLVWVLQRLRSYGTLFGLVFDLGATQIAFLWNAVWVDVWFGCYTDCVPMERCLGGCLVWVLHRLRSYGTLFGWMFDSVATKIAFLWNAVWVDVWFGCYTDCVPMERCLGWCLVWVLHRLRFYGTLNVLDL